ncbi:MAG: YdeI/OmpD-associated family protein [Candidatus Promineifilaceae bacterium]|nr:YdeI/OmpD-associated family protein [Candidatus Promineifilaceae bacterium]
MTHETRGDLPIIPFATQEEWEQWLENNHESAPGVWLKLAKKSSKIQSVSYAQAVESALCYGWIDGLKNRYDDQYWLQRFTHRRPKSKWSRLNRERAEQLIEEGRVKSSGMKEIEEAMADGRWDKAYEPQATITVPNDFQQCLDENPTAREFFAGLNSRNRYAILFQIEDAKRPETRARRIKKFIDLLNEQKKLY